MRNKTDSTLVDLATAHDLKHHRIIKLLRNRIGNSVVHLTIVW